jgi:hypothetical protein
MISTNLESLVTAHQESDFVVFTKEFGVTFG